jgi:hypothetical protein
MISLHKSIAGTDKKRLKYIDSHMANLYSPTVPMPNPSPSSNNAVPSSTPKPRDPERLGRIQEVDLGPSAAQRNIERTEAAKRNLESSSHTTEPSIELPRRKIRLGRDGKPYVSRRFRDRRTDADLERDRAVEDIMRENNLAFYDEVESEVGEGGDGKAADERLAEQFRQEYLDEVERQRERAKPSKAKAAEESGPRGPKLGGSRSARTAFRAREMESAAPKKK